MSTATGFDCNEAWLAICKVLILPLWQLLLRLQFALHWAVQSVMVHVCQQHQTELPGVIKHLLRAVDVAERPKHA